MRQFHHVWVIAGFFTTFFGSTQAARAAAVYTTIVDTADSLCLADPGYSTSPYTQPLQWKCDGGADNNFELSKNSDGSYKIQNQASGMCLDVLNWSTTAGGEIDQYTCDGDANQNFALTSVSSGVYTMKSKSSGLCVSLNGSSASGAGVVQEPCGGSGQDFKMTVPGVTASPSPSPSPKPSPSPTPKPSPSPSPKPSPSPSPSSLIPPNATKVVSIQGLSDWIYKDDPKTSGDAYGSSHDGVTSPSLDGNAREFVTTFSSSGGELYSANFGNDTTSTHFVYDTYLYLVNPSANANIEMDLNQVMSNGKTVIFGFQCSYWDGTWDYTSYNSSSGQPKWNKSNLACNPRNWTANTWHHIQIGSERDSSGNVTYEWVSFDGVRENLVGATAYSAFSLGWGVGSLVMNFQIDGYDSGTSTVYTDEMTTYRW